MRLLLYLLPALLDGASSSPALHRSMVAFTVFLWQAQSRAMLRAECPEQRALVTGDMPPNCGADHEQGSVK